MSKKISQLPVITTPADTDIIPAVPSGGETGQFTVGELLTTQHPNNLVWNDLQIQATQFKSGVSSKPDFDFTEVGYAFDPDVNETIYITAQMPHAWAEGTDIKPHIHWMTQAAGDVVWQLEYRWTNVGEIAASGFTATTAWTPVFTWSSGMLHNITSLGTIAGAGKTLSSMLQIKITRLATDAADTYGIDALMIEFDLHYQSDGLGSDQEYIK